MPPINPPKSLEEIPGPRPSPLVGNVLDFVGMEIHERFYQYTLEFGDIVKFYLPRKPVLLVNSPELLEQVMISDRESYHKQTPTDAFKPIVRESIFIVNKPEWTFGREHHPYTSDYAEQFFEGMVPAIASTTRTILADRVQNNQGKRFDLYPELVHVAFQCFSCAVTGQTLSDRLFRDFVIIMAEGAFRLKTRLPSVNPKFWLSLRRWFDFLETMSSQRRSQRVESPQNVLDYVAANGSQLADDIFVHELSTMITGGVHPVATALAAFFYLSNRHPEQSGKLIQEVREFVDRKQGAPFTLSEMNELPQLDWFIHETLRLYSPVAIIARAVMPGKTVVLNGVEIPENTEVFMSSWAMHRSPKHWDNPLRFRPERFEVKPSPLTFFPFGIGERTCVGKPFAEVCLKTMLTVILSAFDVKLDASGPLRTSMSTGFIKPKDKITADITPRSRN